MATALVGLKRLLPNLLGLIREHVAFLESSKKKLRSSFTAMSAP